jgi:ABC-type amino acid transport system permease subunit
LQRLGALYVEIFRNLPLLVLLFISFAGLRRAGIGIGPWTAGIASLGVYTSAYVAESLRSGVFAVSRGQREAGLSLGFTQAQTLRHIVLPQAFRTVIPPLGSITIAMIKNSAIIGASLLALPDLLKQARIVNSNTFQTTESFFWAAVGYMLLTVTVTVLFRNLESRYAVKR